MDILKLRNLLQNGKTIFDILLRIVYYARVSTDKDEQLNSLDNQVKYFEEFIGKNKNWIYAGRYIDEGISGMSIKKRESFMKMIEDGKNGLFDLIITKEISRFSRNTLDSIKYTQELLKYGVGVYFQSDNINTFEPDSELRLTIMASLAQDEVRKLSERVKFGFKRSVENGKVLGQDNMFGYDKKNGVLTVNEQEAEIVRRIFETYIQGKKGVRAISKELEKDGIVAANGKMINYSSLFNIITNPKYKGFYCGRKYYTPDYRDKSRKLRIKKEDWVMYRNENIPAIVSEEIWDEANRIADERGKKFKDKSAGHQNRYSYSGKIFCAEHGTSYNRHVYPSTKGDKEVWNCRLYRLKGKKDGCDSPTIYSAELNEILTEIFRNVYNNINPLIDNLLELYSTVDVESNSKEQIAEKQAAKDKINKKKDTLFDLRVDNIINNAEFAEKNNLLNDELAKIDIEIQNINSEKIKTKNNEKQILELKKCLEKEWSDDLIYTENLKAILLDKIIVHKTGDVKHVKMEIYLKFGEKYVANYIKKKNSISLKEIGISQAQVSRLEKNALSQMKKYFV